MFLRIVASDDGQDDDMQTSIAPYHEAARRGMGASEPRETGCPMHLSMQHMGERARVRDR